MTIILYIISALLLTPRICRTEEKNPQYIYPVVIYELANQPHALVFKQWSIDKLELYDFDMTSDTETKLLMALYTPAAVTMLPNKLGFSFVDNGRIRIKYFEKRSVKSLDIYKPVYGIELVRWLDNNTCYFHAQSDNYYGIYLLTVEEELTTVLAKKSFDYTYPNIIGHDLFYIEHTVENNRNLYSIGACSLDAVERKAHTIISFGSKHIIMLRIISGDEGFVIECGTQHELCTFHFHHLVKKNAGWTSKELFTFEIPFFFIDGPCRLYESLLPLEPRCIDNLIYYSSYNMQTGLLEVFDYNKKTEKISFVANSKGHLFVPRFLNNNGFAGGTLYPFQRIIY